MDFRHLAGVRLELSIGATTKVPFRHLGYGSRGFIAVARGWFWPDSETSESIGEFRLLGDCGREILALRISPLDPLAIDQTDHVMGRCNYRGTMPDGR